MKIKITPIDAFSVEIEGHDLGNFELKSQWQGMILLENKDGKQIVMEPEFISTLHASPFDKIFGGDGSKKGMVIKASPDIIGAIK